MKRMRRPAGDRRLSPGPGARRLFRRLLALAAALLVIACGVLGWLVFFTGLFKVQKVNVTGNSRLSAEYVRQLSLVDSYKNMITLPVESIARNLEQDPWISEARIERHLPGTVNIEVVERAPMVMLDYGGTGFIADRTGYIISGSTLDQYPELPRVFCGEVPPPKISDRPADARVRDCLKVVASMPAQTRGILLLGNPFDGRGQVFQTRLGFNIIFGDASDLAKKNDVLTAITTDVRNNGRRIAYVDVRVPDSPVIAPI